MTEPFNHLHTVESCMKMSKIAAKALFFRYLFMLRQRRWRFVFAAIVMLLMFILYAEGSEFFVENLEYEVTHKDVEVHDWKSLRTLPRQMSVAVCPDGVNELILMEIVSAYLRAENSTIALNISFFETEEEMVDQLQQWYAEGVNSSMAVNPSTGVVFNAFNRSRLEYTIRPLVPDRQSAVNDWGAYLTADAFPFPMDRGPRSGEPYFDGIIQLQVAIDLVYTVWYLNQTLAKTLNWHLSSFPYPPYRGPQNRFQFITSSTIFLTTFHFFIMYSLTTTAVYATYIVKDKEDGMRELLSVNGAPRWMVTGSWLAGYIVEGTILAVAQLLLLKTTAFPIIEYTSSSVLMIFLLIWNWSVSCSVFLLTSISTNPMTCNYLISFWFHLASVFIVIVPPDRFVLQGILATIPNAALVTILRVFQEFDGAETELSLKKLFKAENFLSVGTVLIIMLATMVVLVLLAFYVDLIMPGPYGRAMPWYLFTRQKKSRAPPVAADQSHDGYFEEINSKDPIGLQCVNIYKIFGRLTAVDNVSLKILKNKVTVLLGPNGAGKSTLFSILCGMRSPTHGHFYTDQYNVFQGNNIKRFRKALGYCPQNNMLQNEFTVEQHMVIFGLLKGHSLEEARKFSNHWTALFEMEAMRTKKAKELSGGSKRKLSLAIALTGKPKYLLLDEPSSGLDGESVRKFWNIILKEKGHCTIVLTTHNMEEAEFLADWIACMGDGQLKAYGSIKFLKNLSNEYKLSCATNEVQLDKVISTVRGSNRSATISHRTRRTVTFNLPSDNPKAIPNLMKRLDAKFEEKIALSLSHSTMDDVLIKLNKEKKKNFGTQLSLSTVLDPKPFTIGQVLELIKKRIKWLKCQNLFMMILVVIVAPAAAVMSIMFAMDRSLSINTFPERKAVDLKLTLDKYKGSVALISRNSSDALKAAMSSNGVSYEEQDHDILQALEAKSSEDLFYYRNKIVFAFEMKPTPIAYYSRNAFHSAPIAFSTLMNALIQGRGTIVTHNFPFVPVFKEKCLNYLSLPTNLRLWFYGLLMASTVSVAASHFIVFPQNEKQCLFKHLQLMTGILPLTYWIANLLFDLPVFTLSGLTMLTVWFVMDKSELFHDSTVIEALALVVMLYGINAILVAYLVSFSNFKPTTLHLTYILYSYAVFIVCQIFFVALYFVGTILCYSYLYIAPWITLVICLGKIMRWAEMRRFCYGPCTSEEGCIFIRRNPLFTELKNELIGFAVMAAVHLTVIIALDHGLGRKLKAMIKQALTRKKKSSEDTGEVDSGVYKEVRYVEELKKNGGLDHPVLVCDSLGMTFHSLGCCRCDRRVDAVRNVTFTTDAGELFGLLGANGAGKTTTFNMLAGVISPTKGDVTIRDRWKLSNCDYKYMKNIGYCPQFEGLLPGLSGRSVLHLFGLLRGIKRSTLDSLVEQWLEALEMTPLADRPCDKYSGGNKRKLSFAAAMIGLPPVVLLDEPTSGVDPIVRQRMWDILMDMVERHDQAFVLSSQTISDSEFICDRLTILVNGDMKCLGSVPKLKNTFGKSCTLMVKLREDATPQEEDAVRYKISSRLTAILVTAQQHHLLFNIKTDRMKIYYVFGVLTSIQEEESAMEDFSLAETPLEEIFLMFSRGSKEMDKSP